NSAYAFVGYLFGPGGENVTADQVKKLTAANKELAALAATTDIGSSPTDVGGKPLTPAEKAEMEDIATPAGQKLIKELKKNYNVTHSINNSKEEETPLIIALISPSSQDCKTFWQKVRDEVMQGHLIVRLYPAGIKDSDDERASSQLLDSPDP